jgi:hypothetical protein
MIALATVVKSISKIIFVIPNAATRSMLLKVPQDSACKALAIREKLPAPPSKKLPSQSLATKPHPPEFKES